MACLDAIERVTPAGPEHEVLVLDNASEDGSVEAVMARRSGIPLLILDRPSGKAANDSTLLQAARGEYCLLLNEDTELQPGAVEAMLGALDDDPDAAVAVARLLRPDGSPQHCAWRLPGVGTALPGALFLHRLGTGQSPRSL